MKILFLTLYSAWICSVYFTNTTAQYSRSNFAIKRLEVCNNNRGLVKLHGNVTYENGNQYATYNITTSIPFDDNLGVNCLIETEVFKNTFAELFTVREKNLCKAGNSFGGELWYDIQRAALLPPGVCPMPPGKYHIRHLKLDFTKMALQTFPFGKLRFTFKGVDNRSKNTDVFCLQMEVDNKMM